MIYYINYDVISKSQLTGFRVIARPNQGFSFYHAVEYRFDAADIDTLLKPNETLYLDIELHRRIDKAVFLLDEANDPKMHKEGVLFKSETRHDFKDQQPIDKQVD